MFQCRKKKVILLLILSLFVLIKAKPEVSERIQEYKDIKIVHRLADITKETTDCIVNAANNNLAHGGGVAYAIAKAGGKDINQESKDWVKENGKVKTGETAYTSKGNLPCKKFVIHTVGPIWRGGNEQEDELLQSAVKNAFVRASELNQTSISIPAISSGIFGYPIKRACNMIAKGTKEYIDNKEDYNNTLQTIVMCNLIKETHNILYDECVKVFEENQNENEEEEKEEMPPENAEKQDAIEEIESKLDSVKLDENNDKEKANDTNENNAEPNSSNND